MKLLSLLMNRKKEIFEFISVKNLELEEITSVSELISWVEQENARLFERGECGSVVAVKKNHKGKTLFATKIDLPISLETDFDEHLYEFYTKKPVPFDQSILNVEEKTEQESISVVSAQKEVGDYAPVPEILDSPLEESEEERSIHEKSSLEKDMNMEAIEHSNTDFESKLPVTEVISEIKHSDLVSEPLTKESMSEEMSKLTIIEREVIKQPTPFTAKSFEQRLNAFIDQELKNIQNEIQLIDKRDLIETEVSSTVRQEEERMLELIDQTLTNQRVKAIEEENLRHQKELEAINACFEQETQKQRMDTIRQYEKEAKKRIIEEYQRQTEEIEQIVQLRISMFQERREKLGENFEKNLNTILSTVQQGNQVSEEDSEHLKQTKNSPPLQTESMEDRQVLM
ncbi:MULTISPECIES: hypothetical protein [unclassified Enterococcus]|uniref:hypothetical protein n=1 Tax=unclassified Enterococcus TaxID=2608891 RepID=UPI0013ECC235|nr:MULTISPECIES: hypothetical protein [unclassified Enterococcus]